MKNPSQKTDLGRLIEIVSRRHEPAAHAKGVYIESVVDTEASVTPDDLEHLLVVVNGLITDIIRTSKSGQTVSIGLRKVSGGMEFSVGSAKNRYVIFFPINLKPLDEDTDT